MARKSRKAAGGVAAVPAVPAAKVWRCAVYARLSCRNNWQTRRNRDSITFDEWVDLDLWQAAVVRVRVSPVILNRNMGWRRC